MFFSGVMSACMSSCQLSTSLAAQKLFGRAFLSAKYPFGSLADEFADVVKAAHRAAPKAPSVRRRR